MKEETTFYFGDDRRSKKIEKLSISFPSSVKFEKGEVVIIIDNNKNIIPEEIHDLNDFGGVHIQINESRDTIINFDSLTIKHRYHGCSLLLTEEEVFK